MKSRLAFSEPPKAWTWDRAQLSHWQVAQFNSQLDAILLTNRFYQKKFVDAGIPLDARIRDIAELAQWPTTTKQELVDSATDDEYGISRHHSFQRDAYSRVHRTSGTTGKPMMLLDTADDWQWWSDCWQHVLTAANVAPHDRVFLAFSFGPFIGFWSAHQACIDRGALAIPAGGLSSLARLEFMRQSAATVVCCTPTYALHLVEVADAEGFPLAELPVDRLIVAGEAGGSVPAVRHRIESAWQARVIDHAGATEIGAWGFGWPDRIGLHVIETNFIAEILPLVDETTGELVLTSLGRYGGPLIRYRTGDVVSKSSLPRWTSTKEDSQRTTAPPVYGSCNSLTNFLWLPAGVIGRVDDMVTVRGVNVFPSSIDSIVRGIPEIAEYQVRIAKDQALDELTLTIEAPNEISEKLQKLLMVQLALRSVVQCVPAGTLPRSEAKARRWVVEG